MNIPKDASADFVGIGKWREGVNFGEFSELTLKHNHAPRSAD